jgi:hypothetical protein
MNSFDNVQSDSSDFDACDAYEWEYEDYRDGQPDEAQEWHDFDPDC